METVSIVGSGISGLATAKRLLQEGYEVKIFTRNKLSDTTSNKAAAVWLPYLAKPIDDVNRWSKISYFEYLDISRNIASGISIVDLTVLVKDEDVWWKESLPKEQLILLGKELVPEGFEHAYIIKSPLIETQIYLTYLAKEVISLGAQIQFREIDSLEKLAYESDWVVNCSGLGAIQLANDNSMYPIKGQLLKIDNQIEINPTIADFAFDEEGQQLAYTIPRQDYLILGGTAIKGDFDLTPNSKLASGILERCKQISNGKLKDSDIQLLDVGLRPGRPVIRVEKDNKIIHNYGHGGAGYTVCWGCANDVAELIKGR